jgi:hypothetical protein
MPASLQSSTYVDCVADRNPNSFGPQTVCTTSRSSPTNVELHIMQSIFSLAARPTTRRWTERNVGGAVPVS